MKDRENWRGILIKQIWKKYPSSFQSFRDKATGHSYFSKSKIFSSFISAATLGTWPFHLSMAEMFWICFFLVKTRNEKKKKTWKKSLQIPANTPNIRASPSSFSTAKVCNKLHGNLQYSTSFRHHFIGVVRQSKSKLNPWKELKIGTCNWCN